MLEEIRHHQVLVGARLQLELNPHVVGRQILDVDQMRHLAAEDDVADALDELRLVDGVGNAGDVDDLAAARRPARSPTSRACGSVPWPVL